MLMIKQRKLLYVHKTTGNITQVTKKQAKQLGPDWSRVEFTKNDQGVRVMRLQLEGATVDISERDVEQRVGHGQPVAN